MKFHIILQNIRHKACQEVSQITRFSISTQHFHLILAEYVHSISVSVHTIFITVQSKPNPVKDWQFIILQHISKTFIETRFKYNTAGINPCCVFLTAASSYQFSEQLTFFQQIFLFSQNCYHNMGTMFFCYLYCIVPHIVVFRVYFRFAVGNRISSKADGSKHISHFKH